MLRNVQCAGLGYGVLLSSICYEMLCSAVDLSIMCPFGNYYVMFNVLGHGGWGHLAELLV